MSTELKQLKEIIEQLDEELSNLSVLDHYEATIIKARRNSKAREYNSKKKFWQLSIPPEY